MGRDHHHRAAGGWAGAGADHSCSSSIDSSNSNTNNFLSFSSSSASSSLAAVSNNACRRDLSTDLKLGLSITPTSNNNVDVSSSTSSQSEQRLDWPPIKALLRGTLVEKAADRNRHGHGHASLFVKVYMEGVPIGRKLDLLALGGYSALMTTLRHMFRTNILCPAESDERVHSINSQKHGHLLTYEDKEGDWMMVGDVPWDVFLTTVKRLKITRADRC